MILFLKMKKILKNHYQICHLIYPPYHKQNLSYQLVTYNKNVKIKVGMTASGEIVTEDLRLIEKLFYEIRKYVKR